MKVTRFTGLKAWLFFLALMAGVILVLVIVLGFFLFLLPFLIGLVLLGLIFGLWKKKPMKKKKDYVDVEYKVK